MVKTLNLKDILKIIWKNLWIIVLCGIICGGAFGFFAKTRQVTTYTSSRSMLIGHNLSSVNGRNKAGVLDTDLRMMSTYSELLKDKDVMRAAYSSLPKKIKHQYKLDSFSGLISTKNDPNSLILEISVSTGSEQDSVKIANVVSQTFKEKLPRLIHNPGTIKLLAAADEAETTSTVHPSIKKYAILGLAIGILVGMVIAFSYSTWKTLV